MELKVVASMVFLYNIIIYLILAFRLAIYEGHIFKLKRMNRKCRTTAVIRNNWICLTYIYNDKERNGKFILGGDGGNGKI